MPSGSQILKHRARFEPTGWQHRRAQMVRWDLVNEYIDRLLHRKPENRAISTQVESAVRSGLMGPRTEQRASSAPSGLLRRLRAK